MIHSSSIDRPPDRRQANSHYANALAIDSVALAFQMRAIPKSALQTKIRDLDQSEMEELELATDEALGRVEAK